MLARDRGGWSRVRYQPAGQGQQLRWALCPTMELDALRTEIEAQAGELGHWRSETFSEARNDIPNREIGSYAGLGMSSTPYPGNPSAWPPIVTVVPVPRPPDG